MSSIFDRVNKVQQTQNQGQYGYTPSGAVMSHPTVASTPAQQGKTEQQLKEKKPCVPLFRTPTPKFV